FFNPNMAHKHTFRLNCALCMKNLNFSKMKNTLQYFLLFSFVLILFSCGNADDDVSFDIDDNELGIGKEPDDCLGFEENELLLSIQDEFTTLPGKVSILFKVSDLQGNPVSGLTADQFTIY